MTNKEIVHNKLSEMRGYLDELYPLLEKDSRAILEDNLTLHSVERLFQLVADSAVDINNHIISAHNINRLSQNAIRNCDMAQWRDFLQDVEDCPPQT